MDDLNDILMMTDDALAEQACLIHCGVRSLTLLSPFPSDPLIIRRVVTRLETVANGVAIPFAIDRGDGTADCGFAANRWVVETFQWVLGDVPQPHFNRVLGLLLGYSASAIQDYEQRQSICLANELPEPKSS